MHKEQMPSQSWEAWKGIYEEVPDSIGRTVIKAEVVLPFDGADAVMTPVRVEVPKGQRANLPA